MDRVTRRVRSCGDGVEEFGEGFVRMGRWVVLEGREEGGGREALGVGFDFWERVGWAKRSEAMLIVRGEMVAYRSCHNPRDLEDPMCPYFVERT